MNQEGNTLRDEVARARRVADMMCTAHAGLKDRYAMYALMLDLGILALSTWLVALAFVAPQINASLTPLGIDSQIWSGLLATLTFLLTITQMKVDWKGRSDAHKRSLLIYADVKREAGYLLASTAALDEDECRRVLSRYDMASSVSAEIPEREFLRQKKRHRVKIQVSNYLDDYPSASIILTKFRLWLRDNKKGLTDDGKS